MRKLNLYPLVPASHALDHLTRKQMPFVFSRVLLVFAFFTLAPASSFAQWVAQISGTTNHVLGIHFVDPNTGYAAGTAGTLLKTTNGGVTWNAQTSGSGSNFYAVCFTNASTGVAVGDNSLIARTTDGGANWSLISAPVFADWRNVWFLDTNTGFITGGLSGTTANLLKTTDGGATWTDISPATFPASSEVLYSGYCVGGDQDLNTTVILKTTDAGATWTALDNPYPAANYLIDVEFIDASTGYAAGGHVQNNTGAILKTTDAGQSWTIENTTPPTTSRLYRLSLPRRIVYTTLKVCKRNFRSSHAKNLTVRGIIIKPLQK